MFFKMVWIIWFTKLETKRSWHCEIKNFLGGNTLWVYLYVQKSEQ